MQMAPESQTALYVWGGTCESCIGSRSFEASGDCVGYAMHIRRSCYVWQCMGAQHLTTRHPKAGPMHVAGKHSDKCSAPFRLALPLTEPLAFFTIWSTALNSRAFRTAFWEQLLTCRTCSLLSYLHTCPRHCLTPSRSSLYFGLNSLFCVRPHCFYV